jgi:predicted transposase YbfD/YdcC
MRKRRRRRSFPGVKNETTEVFKEIRRGLLRRVEELEDPRVEGRCRHLLSDIVVLSFCGFLSGGKTYEDIQMFGVRRRGWLAQFLDLPNGIPSHDTIRRVISLLKPAAVEAILLNWAQDCRRRRSGLSQGQLIVDGKSLRGSDKGFNTTHQALHLVNVYDAQNSIVIAQGEARGRGAGESKTALECLKSFALKGALVSADAGLAYEVFTSTVVKQKGDYLVPIKSNQAQLYQMLEAAGPFRKLRHETATTKERAHGREEKRQCWLVRDERLLDLVRELRPTIKSVFQITRWRRKPDKRYTVLVENEQDGSYRRVRNTSQWQEGEETIFYISSRELDAEECLARARAHWEIENKLHWALDVSFGEDSCTVRDRVAARNLSVFRKLAYNAQSVCPLPAIPGLEGKKLSRRSKLFLGSLDESYLTEVLLTFVRLAG